uniref:poliovirus receptor-like n=1 Tax=Centroberyx gerrardi TaxID=166262 RepID=UPI003AABE887
MNVSSVEAEGEYICMFVSEDEDFSCSTYLTVLARPDTHILVNEETVNGTHYQSVSCSAVNGRPLPQISWLVNSLPPSVYPFTVEMNDTAHPDGTATMSSTLRFPTHLQDEDRVTCVVQHPTLPSPKLTTVRVDTYETYVDAQAKLNRAEDTKVQENHKRR